MPRFVIDALSVELGDYAKTNEGVNQAGRLIVQAWGSWGSGSISREPPDFFESFFDLRQGD